MQLSDTTGGKCEVLLSDPEEKKVFRVLFNGVILKQHQTFREKEVFE